MTDPLKMKSHFKRTEETRARISASAQKKGVERSRAVKQKVVAAMRAIRKEIAASCWSHSAGRVELDYSELCRRAGIHNTTLYPKRQDDEVKKEWRARLFKRVNAWVKAVNKRREKVERQTRRSQASRIEDWKTLYDGLANSNHISELQLKQATTNLANAQETIEALKLDVIRLTEIVVKTAGSNVVQLQPKGRDPGTPKKQ
ncbi:hypothetical protein NHH73_22380 [Oxalobacteraceae bacterium OTU3CINTB1]|nr:hypothetical protein NHH73_22380 [Oxalobacteraceae bacterium OTU3CINTB1]